MPARSLVELHAATVPSRFIRKGFRLLPESYDCIVSVATSPPPKGRIRMLELPPELADRLIQYQDTYYNDAGKPIADINCAHFARFMCGLPELHWRQSMQSLDGMSGDITLAHDLPPYHLGIIASRRTLCDNTNHFLHAGIGLGGEWKRHMLNVVGWRGHLGIVSTQLVLDYTRESIRRWYPRRPPMDPVGVHLYDRGEIPL